MSSGRKRRIIEEDEEEEENIEQQQNGHPAKLKKRIEVQHTQNITNPTPDESRLTGDVDAYITGSIVRVKLFNFVTYSDIEFKPGPRLNVIIGPNGSGKSSIVCAIALGLGGKPNVRRAKQVTEFIKHGCDRSFIEIELFNENGNNWVVRREMHRSSNSSDFKLNGKPINHNDLLTKVREMNVQVDNLCQFLPQDKVVSFAAMSPTELLVETEKAIGTHNMYENHMKLIEIIKEQNKLKNTFTENEEALEDLKKKNEAIEKDVDEFNERKKLLEVVENLKKKKAWYVFEECRMKVEGLKKRKAEVEKILKEKKFQFEPLRVIEGRLKISIEELKKKSSQLSAKINEKEADSGKRHTTYTNILKTIDGLNSELDGLQSRTEGRKNEIAKVNQTIVQCQRQIESLVDDASVKVQIEEKNKQLRELNVRQGEIQFGVQEFNTQLNGMEREWNGLKKQLDQLNNRNEMKLEAIRRLDPDVYKAYQWIRHNPNYFEKPIFGPICLEMNVENEDHAKYLEFSMPNWLLTAFVPQTPGDKERFIQELVEKQRLRLNSILLVNRTEPRRDYNIQDFQKFGITHFLDQTFDSNEYVKDAILDSVPIHNIGAGTNETNKYYEDLAKSNLNIFFTPQRQYYKSRSQYGNRNVSTRISNLRPSKILSGVNLQLKNDLVGRITEVEARINEVRAQRDVLIQEEKKLLQLQKSIHEERNKLQSVTEERKKLYNKITYSQRRIDELNAEEDEVSIEKKIKHNIIQKHKEKVRLLSDMTNNMIDIGTMMLQRDFIIIRQSKEEGRLLFQERVSANLEREVNQLQLQFNDIDTQNKQAIKIAREKKIEAELLAPLTDEMTNLFEQLAGESVDEIDKQIVKYNAKAAFIHQDNPAIIEQYEQRKIEIQEMEDRINGRRNNLQSINDQMEKVKKEWMDPVKYYLEEINKRFKDYFSNIKCQGEVQLGFDETAPDDFSKYSIDIRVKFRNEDNLKTLNAQMQSGGERSVSTMLFLISLQELTSCPFRVVDEINQGMDPKNERMIFEQIVNTANRPGLPQYFLITPKLLHDLKYSTNTTVLCVFTGPWHLTQREWEDSFQSSMRSKIGEKLNGGNHANGNGNHQQQQQPIPNGHPPNNHQQNYYQKQPMPQRNVVQQQSAAYR
eukprot:gene3135-3919_t